MCRRGRCAGRHSRIRHKRAVCANRTRAECRTGNFVDAICGARRLTISVVAVVANERRPNGSVRATQQIMLRGQPKTVESCRAGAPNRDNRHFGDA
ncbi:hypothetical protein DB771_14840 [Burkholderia sp. AU29985]|nr:hypothetical protein XM57_02150 [Burkholderia cepacia]AYZ95709.1 hypothetical protein EGY28_11005 [Burkholderia dolosa]ETP61646.1 hypothetical protein BDSB_28290 [Burkholderia dolosa PC543]PRE51942.1 hypothetical protein C6P87_09505 [Burkholderia sp. AU12872]PUA76109.1 hypothetical protein DB771_14840 [Burkholderia sp. AU29985]